MPSGDRADVNKTECLSDSGKYCDFQLTYPVTNKVQEKCSSLSEITLYDYSENINVCIDTDGEIATCSNNCIGVAPKGVEF